MNIKMYFLKTDHEMIGWFESPSAARSAMSKLAKRMRVMSCVVRVKALILSIALAAGLNVNAQQSSYSPFAPFASRLPPAAGGGGGGGWIVITNTGKGSPDAFVLTTDAVDTTGADFLVAIGAYYDAVATPTIRDSKGNTWSQSPVYGSTSEAFPDVVIAWSKPSSVGSGHTFTFTNGTVSYASVSIVAFSGGASATLDATNGATYAGTSAQPGSVTPSVSGCLIITGMGSRYGTNHSVDSGFVALPNIPLGAGVHYGVSSGYKIKSNAAAENPTWTWTPWDHGGIATTVFKP